MTLRQHLETAWQMTGQMPDRLSDAPELPQGCENVWRTFITLRSSCPSAGMGLGRISFAEMDACERMTGEKLMPWEVQAVRAADRAYIDVWAEARP